MPQETYATTFIYQQDKSFPKIEQTLMDQKSSQSEQVIVVETPHAPADGLVRDSWLPRPGS